MNSKRRQGLSISTEEVVNKKRRTNSGKTNGCTTNNGSKTQNRNIQQEATDRNQLNMDIVQTVERMVEKTQSG